MTQWKLKCIVKPGGRSDVQNIYDRGSDDLKASFETSAHYLLNSPKESWTRPKAAKLSKVNSGGFRDYYEMRFKANNVEQRPIGYFGPEGDDFTILVWAIEKGNKFKPPTWREKADHARKLIEEDTSYAKLFEFED